MFIFAIFSSSTITMSDLFSLEDIKSRLDQLDQEKKDLETENGND